MRRIRQARLDEIELLNKLTLASKSYWNYSAEFIEKCRPHLEMTEDYINNWPVQVLEVRGHIVAYFSLKTISGEDRLDNLWVEPSHIKNGYGKILFHRAVEEAKNLGWNSFRLAGEEGAVGFYEKQGAKRIGKVSSRLGSDIFLPHMEYVFKPFRDEAGGL
jgi:GNAT superfamily N-acetyltransferase